MTGTYEVQDGNTIFLNCEECTLTVGTKATGRTHKCLCDNELTEFEWKD